MSTKLFIIAFNSFFNQNRSGSQTHFSTNYYFESLKLSKIVQNVQKAPDFLVQSCILIYWSKLEGGGGTK